jgi:hypothetical protein
MHVVCTVLVFGKRAKDSPAPVLSIEFLHQPHCGVRLIETVPNRATGLDSFLLSVPEGRQMGQGFPSSFLVYLKVYSIAL